MSFMGTPSTMTAKLVWSKPRMVTLASPSPPPCCVAYTPGVVFNTKGRSRPASSSWICAGRTLVKATGVFRSMAMSVTTTASLHHKCLKGKRDPCTRTVALHFTTLRFVSDVTHLKGQDATRHCQLEPSIKIRGHNLVARLHVGTNQSLTTEGIAHCALNLAKLSRNLHSSPADEAEKEACNKPHQPQSWTTSLWVETSPLAFVTLTM